MCLANPPWPRKEQHDTGHRQPGRPLWEDPRMGPTGLSRAFSSGAPVSYTHLTLPTICSV
eukprot:15073722-Alexandrium_andersonii.AAC.1